MEASSPDTGRATHWFELQGKVKAAKAFQILTLSYLVFTEVVRQDLSTLGPI